MTTRRNAENGVYGLISGVQVQIVYSDAIRINGPFQFQGQYVVREARIQEEMTKLAPHVGPRVTCSWGRHVDTNDEKFPIPNCTFLSVGCRRRAGVRWARYKLPHIGARRSPPHIGAAPEPHIIEEPRAEPRRNLESACPRPS